MARKSDELKRVKEEGRERLREKEEEVREMAAKSSELVARLEGRGEECRELERQLADKAV